MSDTFLKEILPIVIWVVIMILSGRIKKKRQKGPVPTKKRRRPSPAPHPPVGAPSRADGGRAPADPGRRHAPPTTAKAPAAPRLQRIVPSGLASLIDGMFAETDWDAALGGQMRRRAGKSTGPYQVLGWIDETTEMALGQLDDVARRLNEAVERGVGDGEFSAATIDEFITLSPRLAATWSRDILADALGLSLLGPAYADLREGVERQRRGRDVVPLAVAGDAAAVRMPYSVRRRVLETGIATFNLEAGWGGSEGWAAGGAEGSFDLGGLQKIPVPAGPMADATVRIFQQLVRSRIPSLEARDLLEISSHHPWRGQLRRHRELARSIPAGGRVPIEQQELLPAFLHLHAADSGGDWEPKLLALFQMHQRARAGRKRSAAQGQPAGRRTRGALVEGLLLTEILGEDLGKPTSLRRAGGRG